MYIMEYNSLKSGIMLPCSYGCITISEEGYILKIVVIKSPKFISGLLRALFRIKKEEE